MSGCDCFPLPELFFAALPLFLCEPARFVVAVRLLPERLPVLRPFVVAKVLS